MSPSPGDKRDKVRAFLGVVVSFCTCRLTIVFHLFSPLRYSGQVSTCPGAGFHLPLLYYFGASFHLPLLLLYYFGASFHLPLLLLSAGWLLLGQVSTCPYFTLTLGQASTCPLPLPWGRFPLALLWGKFPLALTLGRLPLALTFTLGQVSAYPYFCLCLLEVWLSVC